MTGADELTALRAAYRDARAAEQQRALADGWIRKLREQELEADARLDRLHREAELERAEADDWAGDGFVQFLWRIVGRLEHRRDLEETQAIAAAARLATAEQALRDIRAAIAAQQAARAAPADPAAALERLRNHFAVSDPTGYQRLVDLERAAADAADVVREHDEALQAIARAGECAAAAAELLGSARNLGTWDIWGGGGIIASSMKRQRVGEALGALDATARSLERVRLELADIPGAVQPPPGIEMGSTAWTFDVWWDNMFSDLNMQGRIKDTQAQVEQLRRSLHSLDAEVRRRRAQVAAEAGSAAAAADAALAGG